MGPSIPTSLIHPYPPCSISQDVVISYLSVNSKLDHPPGRPRGFAHSSCPWGRVFAPLSCRGVCPGVLNQSKSSIILKKSAIFANKLVAALFICLYTYLQNKRMRRCGVAPPPIIFERLKLPQQIIYRRKENL